MTSINPTIQKIIKRHTKEKGEMPSSQQVTQELKANHPNLVEEYIRAHRDSLLQGVVTKVLMNERNNLRQSELAKRLANGTTSTVFDIERFWTTPYFVPGEGWKAFGNLTKSDHLAIADKYEVAAVAATARSQLHREIASRIGQKTTREVFKPRQLLRKIEVAYDTQALLTGGTP